MAREWQRSNGLLRERDARQASIGNAQTKAQT